MEIKILGTGCKKCDDLYDNVIKALSQSKREAKVEKVEDIVSIMSFGVMSTPALVMSQSKNAVIMNEFGKTGIDDESRYGRKYDRHGEEYPEMG
jgi:hypothetical protein